MFRFDHRNERPVIALCAAAIAALGIASVANAFLPADPHVDLARAQAMLDRAERVQAMPAPAANLRLAQVQVVLR